MWSKIIAYFVPASDAFPRARWRAVSRRIVHDLRRETYALPLDCFRVLAGVLCAAYFAALAWQVQECSHPDGLLDHALLQRIYWFTRLSLLHPGVTLPVLYGLLALAWLGAWGIVLGYRVRLCAGVLFVIAVSFYRWNFIVIYVDDAFMHLLLFWLMLLPVGKTLRLWELRQGWHVCRARWCQVTVSGTVLWCFLANVCLVYLIAGLWKLTSPLWQQGFGLYATLRLPIAYTPDLWQPQHLPYLHVLNHLALIVEPLIPILLLCRPRHPLKWLGLLCQGGFHLGIILTLPVPFVNLGLLGTSLLFFREELWQWLRRGQSQPAPRRRIVPLQLPDKLALGFLVVLSLAVARGIPVAGGLYRPAYAVLWVFGIAQEYHLFDWIDKVNYQVTYRVSTQLLNGTIQALDPASLFPRSFRAHLLRAYLHNIRWMPVPAAHRVTLRYSILTRLAHYFCRTQPVRTPVTAWARVERIRPENLQLSQGKEQLVMAFRCTEQGLVLCENIVGYRPDPACEQSDSGSPSTASSPLN